MYSHLWNRPAGAHGLAHVLGAVLAGDEPVHHGGDHVWVVGGQVAGAVRLVLLLDGGAVVLRQVLGHPVSSLVDQLPEGRGLQWLLAL